MILIILVNIVTVIYFLGLYVYLACRIFCLLILLAYERLRFQYLRHVHQAHHRD